ncbi:hypothetical protein FDP41_004999 [Naegleria fowleri]|uniref:SPRY domain-containing protein n=1 Tax=Naegleria fowleri TaxID=5763 RepID=A0A6A5BLE7_NAEFO|nr:uncharacterized protein FDP41_004999 [Naegleria fowleri]KAF0975672.1 hypothetical protein FDP41_004999 [Naegleria fowleri]
MVHLPSLFSRRSSSSISNPPGSSSSSSPSSPSNFGSVSSTRNIAPLSSSTTSSNSELSRCKEENFHRRRLLLRDDDENCTTYNKNSSSRIEVSESGVSKDWTTSHQQEQHTHSNPSSMIAMSSDDGGRTLNKDVQQKVNMLNDHVSKSSSQVNSTLDVLSNATTTHTTHNSTEHNNPLKKTRSASTLVVRKKVVIYKETPSFVMSRNDIRSPPLLDPTVKKFSLIKAIDESQQQHHHHSNLLPSASNEHSSHLTWTTKTTSSSEHSENKDQEVPCSNMLQQSLNMSSSPRRSVITTREVMMDSTSPYSEHSDEVSTLWKSTEGDNDSMFTTSANMSLKTSPRNNTNSGNPAQFLAFMTEMDEKESILLSPHRKSSCSGMEDEKQDLKFDSNVHSEKLEWKERRNSTQTPTIVLESNDSSIPEIVIPDHNLGNIGHATLNKFFTFQQQIDRNDAPPRKRVVQFKSDSIHALMKRNETSSLMNRNNENNCSFEPKAPVHEKSSMEPHLTVSHFSHRHDRTENCNSLDMNDRNLYDLHITEYTLMNYTMTNDSLKQQPPQGISTFNHTLLSFPMIDGKLIFEISYCNNHEMNDHTKKERELQITFIPKNQIDHTLHNKLVDLIYGAHSGEHSNLHVQQQMWTLRLSLENECRKQEHYYTTTNDFTIDGNTIPSSSTTTLTEKTTTSGQLLTNFLNQISQQFSSSSMNDMNNVENTCNYGFQFKSFQHFVSFIGRALESDLEERKRALNHVTSLTTTTSGHNDLLRVGFAFSTREMPSNSQHENDMHDGLSLKSSHEMTQLVQKVMQDPLDVHMLNTTKGPLPSSVERKILFFIIHYYSSKLDSNMKFVIPLFPVHSGDQNANSESNSTSSSRGKNFEAHLIWLESELEELLYQKHQWEYLMRFSFKVFDSRSIDPKKICISNQNRTIRHVGEKMGWACCILRCPVTPPGGFLPPLLQQHQHDEISSLKTNHILSIKLDSLLEQSENNNSGIFVGIVNAQTPVSQILQNPLLNVQGCESHAYFLKENQFRHGSMVISATPPQEAFPWKSGDILDLVLDYSNHRLTVFRNYHQAILPLQDPPRIDVENNEWYFIVGMQQEGQQVTII